MIRTRFNKNPPVLLVPCLQLGGRSSTSVTLSLQVSQENPLLSHAICPSVPDPSSEEKRPINRCWNGGHVGFQPCYTYNLLSTSAGLNITFGENREMSAGKVFALIWENVQLCNCCLITCVWGATLVFCAHSSGFSVCLWLIFHCLLHVTSYPSPLLLLDKQWNMEDDLLYLSLIFSHPGLVFLKSPMTLLLSATRDHKQQSNKRLIYSSPNPDQPRFSVEALSFPFYCKYTSACLQSLSL